MTSQGPRRGMGGGVEGAVIIDTVPRQTACNICNNKNIYAMLYHEEELESRYS